MIIFRSSEAASTMRSVHHFSMREGERGGRNVAIVYGGEVMHAMWIAASEEIRWA